MKSRFSEAVLLVAAALGLVIVYSAPGILSTRTIGNIKMDISVTHLGYSYKSAFFVFESYVNITNMGPLDAILHEVNLTVFVNNEKIATITLDSPMELPVDGYCEYHIPSPWVTIIDESRVILKRLKERDLDLQISLKGRALIGTYYEPIQITSTKKLGFLHSSLPGP